MMPIEDDRSSASNVADGPSDPIDENTLNNGDAREVDDGVDVDRWPLAGEREQAPRPIPSQVVAYVSTP